MKELVSVIVPVYNEEHYLHKCIDSLTAQTYRDLEIILVDDGSTDASGKICDSYAKTDERIKVLHKNNEGLPLTRTAGLRVARGDYISFLDSDDWIEKDYYEKLIGKFYGNSDVDIVVGGLVIDEDGTSVNHFLDAVETIYSKEEAIYEMVRFKIFGWNLADKIYKKSLFHEEYQWKTTKQMGEDLELNWYLFNKSKSVLFYPYYGYHYAMHENSITKASFTVEKLSDLDRLEYIMEEVHDDSLIKELSRKYLYIANHHLYEMIYSHITYMDVFLKYQNSLKKYIKYVDLNESEIKMYKTVTSDLDKLIKYYEDHENSLKKDIEDFADNYERIYIYGAGVYGRKIANFLINNCMPFNGIVTSNRIARDNYRGYKIIPFYEIPSSYYKCGFILGLGKNNAEQVIRFLKNKRIPNYLDLRNYNGFLRFLP